MIINIGGIICALVGLLLCIVGGITIYKLYKTFEEMNSFTYKIIFIISSVFICIIIKSLADLTYYFGNDSLSPFDAKTISILPSVASLIPIFV
jgi:uncharacterized membrane protein